MKREFVTLYGKAFVENDILFLRSPLLPFGKTAVSQLGLELLFVAAFVLQFFREAGSKRNMGIIVFALLFLLRLPRLYRVLFAYSYRSRIYLSEVVGAEIKDDGHGLQTCVFLRLRSGRTKLIRFRKRENQAEPFLQCLGVSSLSSAVA